MQDLIQSASVRLYSKCPVPAMRFTTLTLFFVPTAIAYCALRLALPDLDFNVASLISQILGLITLWTFEDPLVTAPSNKGGQQECGPHFLIALWLLLVRPATVIKAARTGKVSKVSWTVVTVNALLGCAMLRVLQARLDFSHLSPPGLDIQNVFMISGLLNILMAQVAGWPLQAFLTFCAVTLLNGKGELEYYLRVVGLAYVGYLLLTVILFPVNMAVLPSHMLVDHASSAGHALHLILGKLAEYWVFTLVAFGIMLREKFSAAKSVLCATAPSFLLLSFRLLFRLILG